MELGKYNSFCMNARKLKAIVIGKVIFAPNCLPPLVIDNSPLKIVQIIKDFGTVFNSQLTWTNHLNMICGKTNATSPPNIHMPLVWKSAICGPKFCL